MPSFINISRLSEAWGLCDEFEIPAEQHPVIEFAACDVSC
jgi:hypothetical protein